MTTDADAGCGADTILPTPLDFKGLPPSKLAAPLNPSEHPENVIRVATALEKLGILNQAVFYKVEADYYDWPLEKRAERLQAPDTAHLCKTLLFENTRQKPTSDNPLDPLNSKHYILITQYVSKPNAQKFNNFVRSLNGNAVPRKYYNMRIASNEDNLRLTGYPNGGVCPFGTLADVPIVMTENITKLDPPVIFLGAGHDQYKVSIPVRALVDLGWHVVDLEPNSEPN
ncbi:hypothetical protein BC832DRAFT_15342 [Gaertneriomyces semiglobifer]|nr:hypothetical protein BC832DRAFT_15342 [Gaertneriomyces semiglobifer]